MALFTEGNDPPTPAERAEFDCATQHVKDTYGLPRFIAADVALRLLSMTQSNWTPYPCRHEARHGTPRQIVAYVCPGPGCGILIRPNPRGEYEHDPQACCFICGAWPLEPRFEEPSRSEIVVDSRTAQKPLVAAQVRNQVESERGGSA